MPEVSRFYGIVIAIFYNEHNPPHFHARYGSEKVAIDIQSLQVLEGSLPKRALVLVKEWAALHQEELLHGWKSARNDQVPQRIEPLK